MLLGRLALRLPSRESEGGAKQAQGFAYASKRQYPGSENSERDTSRAEQGNTET